MQYHREGFISSLVQLLVVPTHGCWSLIPADSWQWRGQKIKLVYVTSYLCLFDFEMLFKLSLTATIGLITASATYCKDTRVQWELLQLGWSYLFWELSFQRDTVTVISVLVRSCMHAYIVTIATNAKMHCLNNEIWHYHFLNEMSGLRKPHELWYLNEFEK